MASTPEDAPDPEFEGYTLGSVRGTGLAGVVRQGRNTRGFDVAIEVITAPLSEDESFRRRLPGAVDEATVLEHPSIVSVHELLVADDAVGVVTDRITGTTLARALGVGSLTPAAACLVADSVLRALVAAHRAGVIHGGVGARTVFVGGGHVRLGGFAVGRALNAAAAVDGVTDTYGVARLLERLVGAGASPRALRRVVERGASRRVEHRYRTASGMRTAVASAARRELGPAWRDAATTELAALERGAAPEAELGLRRAAQTRPRAARTMVAMLAAAVIVGALGGAVASAIHGGGASAAGTLTVADPVAVLVEPVHGSCNSVFVATATGRVQGQGTLTYRWERSDGLQTEDTALTVARGDATFLVTEHWQLSGRVVNPRITFRLVSPVAMAVSQAISYSCP